MNNIRRLISLCTVICCAVTLLTGCKKGEEPSAADSRLQVVTTLFPLYDFARAVAGKAARVTMLLPPGVEPHTFEPKPEDMIRISRAGLFIYTNRYMEPWADNIITGINSKGLRVVNAGQRVTYLPGIPEEEHGQKEGGKHNHHHEDSGMDPHIWLDFAKASQMVESILDGFIAADPRNAVMYRQNAESLKKELAELDERYRKTLSSCETNTLLHGGHYTFGYLARRYGLTYHALSGISSDSEPSAERMALLVREIKTSGSTHLFAEELLSPRLTETLAQEANVGVLMLHGAHNLSREDFGRNVTFIDLMERNLSQLQKGLQCREQ
ncbi:MAG: zinc ABC transporter substrate-binding protein [Desulfuromonadaceae bacterium]|nr:zinc ABC transporter substrate-binding protein [Desulfuromonadaceae bacterium]MDD5106200.1 zinc ABC transporter substrate-binding protein [Desulfuromonadaceae bacterium]